MRAVLHEREKTTPPAEKLFGYELANVDLDAPVLRFGDVVLGRDEELALATARRLDALARQPAFDQELAHAIGARARQLVIEVEGAHRVGMADHHDVRQRAALQLGEDGFELRLRFGRELVLALDEVER